MEASGRCHCGPCASLDLGWNFILVGALWACSVTLMVVRTLSPLRPRHARLGDVLTASPAMAAAAVAERKGNGDAAHSSAGHSAGYTVHPVASPRAPANA